MIRIIFCFLVIIMLSCSSRHDAPIYVVKFASAVNKPLNEVEKYIEFYDSLKLIGLKTSIYKYYDTRCDKRYWSTGYMIFDEVSGKEYLVNDVIPFPKCRTNSQDMSGTSTDIALMKSKKRIHAYLTEKEDVNFDIFTLYNDGYSNILLDYLNAQHPSMQGETSRKNLDTLLRFLYFRNPLSTRPKLLTDTGKIAKLFAGVRSSTVYFSMDPHLRNINFQVLDSFSAFVQSHIRDSSLFVYSVHDTWLKVIKINDDTRENSKLYSIDEYSIFAIDSFYWK